MKRQLAPILSGLAAMLLLGACADQNLSDRDPHPLGPRWTTDQHPEAVEGGDWTRGLDCWDCHDESLWNAWPAPNTVLGRPERVFYCHNCHFENAHAKFGEAWLDADPPLHGRYAQTLFIKCSGCHGPAGQGGEVGIDCFVCHFGPDFTFENHKEPEPPAPHRIPPAPLFDVCRGCHEGILRDKPSLGYDPPPWSFCQGCHHPTPETTASRKDVVRWLEDEGHPEAKLKVDCGACHDFDGWDQFTTDSPDLSYNCHNCHTPEGTDRFPEPADPHGDGWVGAHPDYARANFLHCAGCHGTVGEETENVANCFACHFPNWLPPDFDAEEHGEFHQENGAPLDRHFICRECHAAVRATGLLDAPECTSCHDMSEVVAEEPCSGCHTG